MKSKTLFRNLRKFLAVLAAVMVLMSCAVIPAQAAGAEALTIRPLTTGVTEVDTMLTNLNELITGLVKVIGGILCIYGILQVGMSFSGHDPSQRIQGLMCIAGAIIIFFSPEILTAIQK
ncbi:MAG: hypothetical protein K2P41_01040 [Lachnospiraceae bacterium]|nr:hypothetical protein [Lachnospiraceae bacterium]